jgi:hypothetical protein
MLQNSGSQSDQNEIIVTAFPVKYHDIDYGKGFVTIVQNRTRRRVPDGYYFEDTGLHIYVSPYYAHLFSHKKKKKSFLLNPQTKEWRHFTAFNIERHIPERKKPQLPEINETLTRNPNKGN